MATNATPKITWLTAIITFDPSYPNDARQRIVDPHRFLATFGGKLSPLPTPAGSTGPSTTGRARKVEYNPKVDAIWATSTVNPNKPGRGPSAAIIFIQIDPKEDGSPLVKLIEDTAKAMTWAGQYTLNFRVEAP
ncbi:hypothetical protein NMY22_g17379 [Coprinellus aureogranulatus]|nr:hypothetical protein NMY22_g17379 [Coprinellus aureogranulatus]